MQASKKNVSCLSNFYPVHYFLKMRLNSPLFQLCPVKRKRQMFMQIVQKLICCGRFWIVGYLWDWDSAGLLGACLKCLISLLLSQLHVCLFHAFNTTSIFIILLHHYYCWMGINVWNTTKQLRKCLHFCS